MLSGRYVSVWGGPQVRELVICEIELVMEAAKVPSLPPPPPSPPAVTSCNALGQSAPSGQYWGTFGGSEPIPIYCDMDRAGGGWTLLMTHRPAQPTTSQAA